MILYTRSAFTLVELIVVITILSILGTLAFISFQGYASEARNTTRVGEMRSLIRKVELIRLEGMSLYDLVADTSSSITGGNMNLAGYDDVDNFPGIYKAGNIDYLKLNANPQEYTDSMFSGESYKMGVTSSGQRFEIAGTIEGAPNLDSYIIGNWDARNSTNTRGNRDQIVDNIFYTLEENASHLGFFVGDRVGISSGNYVITKLEGNKIYLDSTVTTPGATIFLRTNESRHLIKKWDSNFPIDQGQGELYVPYR